MNRYEKGFITKCAEYGIDGKELLEKIAQVDPSFGKGLSQSKIGLAAVLAALAGVPTYAFSKKENKIKNALASMILAGTLGYGAGELGSGLMNTTVGAQRMNLF